LDDQPAPRDASPAKRPVASTGPVLVVGLGRFGSALANTLLRLDREVMAIDFDARRVQEHAQQLDHVVQADSTNVHALRQIGAQDVETAVVCIGTDIEASVLTAAALVDLEVPNIWAKAITEAHGRILERVGCHHVVFPEADMGGRVAHLLSGSMLEYIALDDDFAIVETAVPAAVAGRPLSEIGLRARYAVTVVCIKKPGHPFTYATADTVLEADDLIVVAGHMKDVHRFATFSGAR
jgi:trk system potassium uptake protein TrkA